MNNIEKIRSMLNGTHRKIQVGPEPKTIHQRKDGERWIDGNGREWIKINGQRKQITKMPARGFDECKDCEKLILKQRDQDTYNRMQRCYHCQINFEVDLKATGKWKKWVIGQETQRWESIEKEVAIILKEMKKNSDRAFDTTMAKALGNENVSQQAQKMKK
jgi:hypothetical protein